MKKNVLIYAMLSMCSLVTFSQLKVTQDGKVGVGITPSPISKFAVGTVGDQTYSTFFDSNNITMNVQSSGITSAWGGAIAALNVNMQATGSFIYHGMMVTAAKSAPANNGRSTGIQAQAGNASSGYNAAVVGLLNGSNNGAGILGSSNGAVFPIDGVYAGYFSGNVKVTGTLNGIVVGSSDIRYKQNITELSDADKTGGSVLRTITNLNPIAYNFKQVYHELRSDTLEEKSGHFDEKSQMFQKKHFGLIAQDLQQIYPDLVYESDNGYLAINYTEIIPLLIQSIKELKAEVDALALTARAQPATTQNDILNATSGALLYQNTPNPFTEKTEIKFNLPPNAGTSYIYVFNMQGGLIKQIPLNVNQKSVSINGSELTAGMYLYSLIVDGREIDTKRMILTK